jgi:hypothetical protein
MLLNVEESRCLYYGRIDVFVPYRSTTKKPMQKLQPLAFAI